MEIIKIPKTPNEVWVDGEPNKALLEMLQALGEQYNLEVWFNGTKVHEAREEDEPQPGSGGQASVA